MENEHKQAEELEPIPKNLKKEWGQEDWCCDNLEK